MNTTSNMPSALTIIAERPQSRRKRAGIGALLGASLAAAALAFGPVSPALAHDELVGTTPANGEVVAVAPESITLSFNNEIIEVGTVVEVTSADGTSATAGDPVVNRTDVVQTLNKDLADGSYTVVWRVVSQDGHPISGTQTFAIGAATEGEAETVTPEAGTEDEHSHDDSSDHADAHDETEDGMMHTMGQESTPASPLPWIILSIALVLAAGAIVYSVRAAKRRGLSAAGDTPAEDASPADSASASDAADSTDDSSARNS